MTYRVGLIGLGVMGVPMAKNIGEAGLPLTVFNRSPEPLLQFKGADIAVASSVEGLFTVSDQIVLMLNTEAAFDEVLSRREGGFGVDLTGKMVVNTATLTPGYSMKLGAEIAAAGGRYVEAPVSGSRAPAEAGDLLVLTAGAPGDVEAADAIFRAIGKESVYCGAVPNAMAMKSASNVLLAGVMGGFAEAISFCGALGLDLNDYAKVILGGPMANAFLEMKFPRVVAKDYSPQASVKNVAEALDVMIATADEAGANIPLARAMRETCAEALHAGLGDQDILALTKVLNETAQHNGV